MSAKITYDNKLIQKFLLCKLVFYNDEFLNFYSLIKLRFKARISYTYFLLQIPINLMIIFEIKHIKLLI